MQTKTALALTTIKHSQTFLTCRYKNLWDLWDLWDLCEAVTGGLVTC